VRAYCQDVDTVIHLAALNEIQSLETPDEALRVNGIGTLKLLLAAGESGVKRFIYFSTAHVYGSPLAGQISEESLPRPVHPYAIAHHVAEDFVLSYHDQQRLRGLVLRLSNGFGAPADPGIDRWTLLTNDLCKQAVTEKTLTLKSPGLQYRDFITISDVSRAVSHFLALENWDDGLFNVGGGQSLRIYDVAVRISERCQRLFGYTPEIKRPAAPDGEKPARFGYSIEKLLNTGFQLESNFDDEIDATLTFCKKHFT
jgi:UDP-glucose 4-epimerase